MAKLLKIRGNKELKGEIIVGGSKNSAVAVIIASLLCKDKVILRNIPHIEDVNKIIKILKYLNVEVFFDDFDNLIVDSSNIVYKDLDIDEIKGFRASYYFMGVMIALFGKVKIYKPGGCVLGERPIDIHLDNFMKVGVNIVQNDDIYEMELKNKNTTTIVMKNKSVGATINTLILASKINDFVILENSSIEPEVLDVIRLINKMGGKIRGSETLIIKGINRFHGTDFKIIPDRIEAGTYAIMAAATNSNITIKNINQFHLKSLLDIFDKLGVNYKLNVDSIEILKSKKLNNIKVSTGPYPLFPTDLQQPLTVLLTRCDGQSIIEENIFAARTSHVKELNKLGANIRVSDNKIIIEGNCNLVGNKISGKDLRGGAALVCAGLISEGESYISGLNYINRGYDNMVNKLINVGADIEVIDDEN